MLPPDVPKASSKERRNVAIHNERVKMRANALNALGIALVGSAFVFPVIRDDNPGALLELSAWVWILMGFALHQAGMYALGSMKAQD